MRPSAGRIFPVPSRFVVFRRVFHLLCCTFLSLASSCSRPSEELEFSRLHGFCTVQRMEYQRVLQLDRQVVLETDAWLKMPSTVHPQSDLWTEMKKLHVRWAAVHVGYRWIAQNFSREKYLHPAVHSRHQKILDHLIDRQFRALKFEKLCWKAYRAVLLGTVPSGIPPEIDQLRDQLPGHPPAWDEIGRILPS